MYVMLTKLAYSLKLSYLKKKLQMVHKNFLIIYERNQSIATTFAQLW